MAKADKFLVTAHVAVLKKHLSRIPEAKGMYVRQWGTNLILGRKAPAAQDIGLADDDRLKLTAQGRADYTLSARTWNGRWERTGFEGPIANLVEVIRDVFTPDQKKDLIERVTDAVVSVEGEALRDVTWVRVQEIRPSRRSHLELHCRPCPRPHPYLHR